MQESEQHIQKPQRPTMLTVLCILSYLGSGISGVTFFTLWSSYKEIIPMLLDSGQLLPGMELLLTAGRTFFLTGAILYFFSFFGVSLMWRMRKAGFHFYVASQVLIAIMPLIYIDGFPLPILEWLITAMFIILYSRFYRLFS